MTKDKRVLVADATSESDDFNQALYESLLRQKIPFEIWKPDRILSPATVRGYGRAILAGVPNIIEAYPFDLAKADYVRTIWEAGLTTLGICLGHQQTGISLGADFLEGVEKEEGSAIVRKNPDLTIEDPLLVGLPDSFTVTTMHLGSVTVPVSCELLASSEHCENQAMMSQNRQFYGVQFHPERSGEEVAGIFSNFVAIAEQIANDELVA